MSELGFVGSHFTGARFPRLRHENLYKFVQNFDQNGLLGEKLGQNEHWSIKNFEIEKNQKKTDLTFFHSHRSHFF